MSRSGSSPSQIQVPTLIVRGEKGHPAMLRIAEVLHQAIPRSSLVSIADGSHFLPSTHAPRLAQLISAQVLASASMGNS